MDSLFQLEYKKQDEEYTMPEAHYHDYYEIYYLYSGERHYLLEDRIYHIHQGDLVLIPPNIVHQTAEGGGTGSHERMLIYFTKSFLSDLLSSEERVGLLSCFQHKLKALRLSAADQTLVETILSKMRKEERRNLAWSAFYQKILLSELLVLASRKASEQLEDYFYPEGPVHQKIHNIVRFMGENYQQMLSLSDLAERFFVSPAYLSRAFKRVTGLTLTEYLNTVRIKEAQRLLRQSNSTVSDVALQVGFSSHTHFGRTFKQMTGLSPIKYRKSHIK
ncbi:MAG: AraC family transcriptional regulator [Bacillota bacterium]|jgi:AraC-like DNA-binding protein|nr:AraC family transcriptional regulator [Bacillota bacterium]HHT89549.1 helix-turn-helix domain-containing protein [Bacillota bacterium]